MTFRAGYGIPADTTPDSGTCYIRYNISSLSPAVSPGVAKAAVVQLSVRTVRDSHGESCQRLVPALAGKLNMDLHIAEVQIHTWMLCLGVFKFENSQHPLCLLVYCASIFDSSCL